MSTVLDGVAQCPETMQVSQRSPLPAKAMQIFHEGWECLQSGDSATAVVVLSRAVKLAPECAPAHLILGIAHALTNNIYPAIDHLEMASRLEEGSFAAHYTLAQLSFKLRILQKGYESAERARRCICNLEQRKMLAGLLKEERARERSGITRPHFNKPFRGIALSLVGGGLFAALVAITLYMHYRSWP